MITHTQSGIQYDPEMFDPEFFDMLAALPDPDDLAGLDTAAPLLAAAPREAPLSPAETDAVLRQAWDDLLASDEGAEIRALSPKDQDRLKAQFMIPPEPISALTAQGLDIGLSPMSLIETEEALTLMQDGKVLMTAPFGANMSKRKKACLDTLIGAVCKCLADAITMAMAAVGAYQSLNQKAVARAGANICTKCGGKIAKQVGAIGAAVKRGSDLERFARMLSLGRAVVGIPKLASLALLDLSGWEKASIIATVVAGLALAFASFGNTFWLSILAMGAALVAFVADSVAAGKAHAAFKAA
ncbi:hypothetical protein EU803_02760 [Loktanella sp. IMCC34160]|uniref:hypothetical protein n=1 Tax=Loktanella sp. IMCC34160 TaxID=2510646 RepID=UPI00101CD7AD|nr:hypothetical protein [Loktanella sp. IMCC34160]RYG93045.1 hypothetical protein EU803_02760 [Loktanella sp. IMCC34160]